MARKRIHEEHINHEAWAIPYGDLVTLLLAFFVVMYAISTVSEGKYRVLSQALNAEFRGPPRSMEPIQVGELTTGDPNRVSPIQSKALYQQPQPTPVENAETHAAAEGQSQDTEAQSNPQPANQNAEPKKPLTTPAEDLAGTASELNEVAGDVEDAMSSLIKENMVAVNRHGLWVEVEIRSDILFPSGVANLSPLAVSVLAPLADAIKPFPNPVRVEGHTDDRPIATREYPSNWELSAARAASVVHLFSSRGITPDRLTVIGLGEFRPIKSNGTEEGRRANRRVVLVILGKNGMPEGVYGNQKGNALPESATPSAGELRTTTVSVPPAPAPKQ